MLLLIVAQLALADIPPPADYVETCTLSGYPEGCVTCEGYHGGREPCEALEKKGYERQCRTGGASVWTEIMCPTSAANADEPPPVVPTPDPSADAGEPAPAEPTPADKESSSKCATLAPAGAAPLLFLLPLLGLRRRR